MIKRTLRGYLIAILFFLSPFTIRAQEQLPANTVAITYHNKACYLECSDIKNTATGPVYNGKVTIREKNGTQNNGRVLCEATYVNGKRSGTVTEWDYDNGVYHRIPYQNGVRIEPSLVFGPTIYSISSKLQVATAIMYASNATEELAGAIVSGMFNFNDGPLREVFFSKGGNIATITEYYNAHKEEIIAANKSGKTKIDYSIVDKNISSGGTASSNANPFTQGGGTKPSESSNYASSDAAAAFIKFKQKVEKISVDAAKIHNQTTYRNYKASQSYLDSYKSSLQFELDQILKYHSNKLSREDMAYVRSVENDFKSNSRKYFELRIRIMYPDH